MIKMRLILFCIYQSGIIRLQFGSRKEPLIERGKKSGLRSLSLYLILDQLTAIIHGSRILIEVWKKDSFQL